MSLVSFQSTFVAPSDPSEPKTESPFGGHYAKPHARLELIAEAKSSDPSLMDYGRAYALQYTQGVQKAKADAAAACRELPEAEAVRLLRKRLRDVNASLEKAQANVSESERRFNEALLKDQPTDQIEAEQERYAAETKRLTTLLRLIGGGSPDSPSYDAACPPVLSAAIEAYQTAAKHVLDSTREQFERENEKQQKDKLASVQSILEDRAVEIAVLREHRSYSKHHFSPNAIPQV